MKVALLSLKGAIVKVDQQEENEFISDVFYTLKDLKNQGFQLILLAQKEDEKLAHFVMNLLKSQGITFSECFWSPSLSTLPSDFIHELERKTSLLFSAEDDEGDEGEKSKELARGLGIRFFTIDEKKRWPLLSEIFNKSYQIKRETKETQISIEILEGGDKRDIKTGIGFFDHMLDTLFRYSGLGVKIEAVGDLHIDYHHLIEDVGICLGEVFDQMLKQLPGRKRFSFHIPMDEAACLCSLDVGGRPHFEYQAQFSHPEIMNIPVDMFEHFFRSLALKANWTLQMKIEGVNTHHMIESAFKSLGMCLKESLALNEDILSTKGSL